MSLYSKVLEGLDKDVLSLSSLDGDFTSKDLRDLVASYESILQPFNLEGKRVALLVPTIKELLPLFLAVNKLKGVVSPLSYQFRQDDLVKVLDLLDPHIVFTINEHSGFSFSESIKGWANSRETNTVVFASDNCIDWVSSEYGASTKLISNHRGGFITFSSGSTGVPKGIVFQDSVFEYGYCRVLEAMNLKNTDSVFVYASTSTLYGVVAMNAVMRVGATLVVSNDFDLVKIIEVMEKKGCNKFTTTPSIFKSLYNFASNLNPEVLKKLETVCVIGEKVSPNFARNFPLLENCTFISHYGSSESGSLANVYINKDSEELQFTLANEVEYKVVDGELLVKTAGMFTEYYGSPALTEAAFEDNWFKMGDLVEFTGERTFKIVGRMKDVIKKGGQLVVSSEVEHFIQNMNGINNVTVVGSPHDIYGEQIVAFVIAQGITAKDIRSYCTGRIASYKIPDKIVFIDELPLTHGKVDKPKLKATLLTGGKLNENETKAKK